MSWGSTLKNALSKATDSAKSAANAVSNYTVAAYDRAAQDMSPLAMVTRPQEAAARIATELARPALEYAGDKAMLGAVKAKDAAVAGATVAKNATVSGYQATKDAAVWGANAAKDAAVSGYRATKDAAVAGANAAKDTAVSGYVATMGAIGGAANLVRQKSITAREQQIRNAYQTGRDHLSDEIAGSPTQSCPYAKAECQRLNDAKEKAILSDYTYYNQGEKEDEKQKKEKKQYENQMKEAGIVALDPKKDAAELKKLLGQENPQSYLEPYNSSFRARVYKKTKLDGTSEYIVAFRGTRPKEVQDLWADGGQAMAFQTGHYNRAMTLADTIRKSNPDTVSVSFTGHSLGGGLASAAAFISGYSASTYNAAGLNMETVTGYDARRAGPVNAYFNAADPLNAVQDNRAGLLSGIAAATGPSAVSAWLLYNEAKGTGVMPPAFGLRRPVPLPAYDTPPSLGEGHGMPLLVQGFEIQRRQLGCP